MSTKEQQTRRQIINAVIDIEGGYVNDPADSGGATKYGITQAVARRHGHADVRNLSKDEAYRIYEQDYWEPVAGDVMLQHAPQLAHELFDTAVNQGCGKAAEYLQITLNTLNNGGKLYPDIAVDRDIGQATLSALSAFLRHRGQPGIAVLLKALNIQQGAFYMHLAATRPKDEKFTYGWLENRIDFQPAALGMPAPPLAPPTLPTQSLQPLEPPTMQPTLPMSPTPDGFVTDETGQRLPYWNAQVEQFEANKQQAFALWIKQQAEQARRASGKSWVKSKIILTGLSLAAGAVVTWAARYGFQVDADTLVNIAAVLLFGGGSFVAIARRWFTDKFLT